ncbi:molecular chaperone [Adlercreutzia sp. ZJ138]|uniref:TorD/DmsD family molecular chaperone n=1 Tax=Adlercreutzia sp. ZJ138 TaxID=2709405 RepID=UPI0013EC9AFB|nr:molecular chaperone TorD family protein [Adlercreutzia sp. ZJ138]
MDELNMEERLPYAAFFELMGLSFSYPDRKLLGLIQTGEYKDAYLELTGLVGLDGKTISDMTATLDNMTQRDAEELFHELRVEYTRLFVGTPKPLVSLSEGVWLGHKRGDNVVLAIINGSTIAVEKFMKSCGIFPSKTNREPIDTIYTECEFMQYLLTKSSFPEDFARTPIEAYDYFLKEHMAKWIPGFAEQVQEITETAWFASLVRTMCAYVELLAFK